jgi:predicted transcriptional regulator
MRLPSVILGFVIVSLMASAPAVLGMPPPVGARDVIEAPEWQAGDAWDVAVFDPGLEAPLTGTLVALPGDAGSWLFAFTSPRPELLSARIIPLGLVEQSPLRFSVDGVPFEALRFPARAQDTWETTIGDAPFLATVTSVNDGIARVTYRAEGSSFTLNTTYDAEQGFVTQMDQPNGQRVEFKRLQAPECVGWSPQGVRSFRGDLARYRGSAVERFDVPASVHHLVFRLAIQADPNGGSPYGIDEPEHHAIKVVGPAARMRESHELVQTGPAHNQSAFFVSEADETGEVAGEWTASRMRPTVWEQWRSVVDVVGYEEARFVEGPGCASGAPWAATDEAVVPRQGPNVVAWLVAGVIGTLAVAWAARRTFAWLLLARITPDRALEHPARERFLARIEQEPGITSLELSRDLEVPWTTSLHHLRILERVGLVQGERRGGSVHWFSLRAGSLASQRVAIATLRSAATAKVHDFVHAHPGASLTAVAHGLGLKHTTVLFHLRKLLQAGLVESRPYGRRKRYHPRA